MAWVALWATAPAQAQRPADAGTIVIVVGQEATLPIPTLISGRANQDVADLLFLRLARIGPDLVTAGDRGFTPELARRWTRRDSVTLVFELDPRARWHDGRPVTARDVVFAFDRARDPQVDPQRALLLGNVSSVSAEGVGQVVVRFTKVYAEQFYDASFQVQPLPAHLLDTIPKDRIAASTFAQSPVGNGPYRWVRPVPKFDRVIAGLPEELGTAQPVPLWRRIRMNEDAPDIGVAAELHRRGRLDEAAELAPDSVLARFRHCIAGLPLLCESEEEIAESRRTYRSELETLRDGLRLETPQAVRAAGRSLRVTTRIRSKSCLFLRNVMIFPVVLYDDALR